MAQLNKKLLNNFAATMKADIALTRIELTEDASELREDRMEKVEDIREIKQKK